MFRVGLATVTVMLLTTATAQEGPDLGETPSPELIAAWDISVAADGTGTLDVTNITSNATGIPDNYVALRDIGTISVRLLTRTGAPPPTAQSHGPNLVVACGEVK